VNDNPERNHMSTTHVLLVTDRSGSMNSIADDVRGAVNAYLDSLAADTEVTYRVTSVLFDDEYKLLEVGAPPQLATRLTERTYQVGGTTALLDAVGKTITDFERSDVLRDGDRVLLVVQSDGHENASVEYRAEQIRQMITDREATGTWGAVFLGAGPDTWKQAGGMGFSTSAAYAKTGQDTQNTYESLTKMSGSFSRGATTRQAADGSGLDLRED
jgi:hypothetical protein